MDELTTEQQQLESIKKWFRKNGKSTMWMLIIALAIGFGIRYWKHHKQVVLERASDSYNEMMISFQKGDKKSGLIKAKRLMENYAHTSYAPLASLNIAKDYVQNAEYEKALESLQWVIDNSKILEFTLMARSRISRILLHQKEYVKAHAILQVDDMDGFASLFAELKGDIYLAQDDIEKARNAYKQALELAEKEQIMRPLLQMKFQEIA